MKIKMSHYSRLKELRPFLFFPPFEYVRISFLRQPGKDKQCKLHAQQRQYNVEQWVRGQGVI